MITEHREVQGFSVLFCESDQIAHEFEQCFPSPRSPTLIEHNSTRWSASPCIPKASGLTEKYGFNLAYDSCSLELVDVTVRSNISEILRNLSSPMRRGRGREPRTTAGSSHGSDFVGRINVVIDIHNSSRQGTSLAVGIRSKC